MAQRIVAETGRFDRDAHHVLIQHAIVVGVVIRGDGVLAGRQALEREGDADRGAGDLQRALEEAVGAVEQQGKQIGNVVHGRLRSRGRQGHSGRAIRPPPRFATKRRLAARVAGVWRQLPCPRAPLASACQKPMMRECGGKPTCRVRVQLRRA
jgi:uncharacterized protein YjbJ (UPF0337 family)